MLDARFIEAFEVKVFDLTFILSRTSCNGVPFQESKTSTAVVSNSNAQSRRIMKISYHMLTDSRVLCARASIRLSAVSSTCSGALITRGESIFKLHWRLPTRLVRGEQDALDEANDLTFRLSKRHAATATARHKVEKAPQATHSCPNRTVRAARMHLPRV